ncbi:transthyretin-like family protein [Chitinophaga vietnamensis]|uniref:hypothetical protein n=1 Tax=Chitinophaga vietnamensis TaxID=2593957 RepID=UPI00117834AA|nr:hypothetical protein [Chitinophaga vietnamensis]
MRYLFKGNLRGYLCSDCWEYLAGIEIRLHRTAINADTIARAAAPEKDTFTRLDEAAIRARESSLIAAATVDEKGNFSFSLDENSQYNGEAFDIDFVCGNVPRPKLPRKKFEPLHFHVTTLQPQWRNSQDGIAVAAWDYSIAKKWWCFIRGLFGAYVICGRIIDCETKQPLAHIKVSAFDVDWLQDDPLGSAITNSNGEFRIDYNQEDFEKTLIPWLNIEWPAGPDLYFHFDTPDGAEIYWENRAVGHHPGRANQGPCFCLGDYCLKIHPETPPGQNPAWTKIGNSIYLPGVTFMNSFDADGYASPYNSGTLSYDTQQYALFGQLQMRGSIPNKTAAGRDVEYRFKVSNTTAPNGTAPLAESHFTRIVGIGVESGLFSNTTLGTMVKLSDPTTIIPITATIADLDAEGWLNVNKVIANTFTAHPTEHIADYYWSGDGSLMTINSTKLTTTPDIPVMAAVAGQPVPVADLFPLEKFAFRFEVREVVDPVAHIYNPLVANGTTLNCAIINNNAPFGKVNMKEHLDHSNFCDILTGDVHVAYTAYHLHLQALNIHVQSNSGGYNVDLAGSLASEHLPLSGNNNPAITMSNNPGGIVLSGLSRCTYTVTMLVTPRLHNGTTTAGTFTYQTTFFHD